MTALAPNTHGLWGDTAVSAPTTAPLTHDHDTEIAIIGAGFTGLRAALELRAEGRDVAVLDSGEIGQGCSGRNGGQVNPGWKMDLHEITAHYGRDHAHRALELAKSTVPALSALINGEGLQCAFIENGYVQGAVGQRGMAAINQRAAQWVEHGIDAEILSAKAGQDLLGTEAYDGVMLHAQGGNLHPLSYARELGRVVIERGGQIFTGSRATTIGQTEQGFTVTTQGGCLRARKVIIATNGYTDQLWQGLAQAVVPVASSLSATAPPAPTRRRGHFTGPTLSLRDAPDTGLLSHDRRSPVCHRWTRRNLWSRRTRIDTRSSRHCTALFSRARRRGLDPRLGRNSGNDVGSRPQADAAG